MKKKNSSSIINEIENGNLEYKMKTQKKIQIKKTVDLGDYILTNYRIGKGAFSTIYLGEDKIFKKPLAIKKLEVENIYKLKKTTKREIKLHKKIKHRNIINLYDVVYDKNFNYIYLILEYCKIGDFSSFQNKRPIQETYIQKYINDLANGLKYLNEMKIIHRDLKPQNLLISDCGDLKIGDFGFAKEFDEMDLKNTYCGSPLYMAPEILHYKKYDNKSDLWSVGVIIFEMITGNPPYHVKNFYQLMKMIDKDITLPTPYNTTISLKLQVLLSKLLIKNPKFRMGWDDFFNDDWLSDKILEQENNLIGISINESLPNLELIKNKIAIPSQTFIPSHTSLTQQQSSSTLSSLSNIKSTDIIRNLHSIETDNNPNQFNSELEFNLIFSSSSGSDSFHSMESSYNEDNDNLEEDDDNNEDIKHKIINIENNNKIIKKEENIKTESMEIREELKEAIYTRDINVPKHTTSKNINIINKSQSHYSKTSSELEKEYDIINEKDLSNPLSFKKFNFELNTDPTQSPIFKQSPIKYHTSNDINNLNNLNKTKKQFKSFLHSSVNILKESYDYLSSHNKSI